MKNFAWSLSRLKHFETCAFKYKAIVVDKSVDDAKGDAAIWGQQVHEAAQKRLKSKTPLPVGMQNIERFIKPFDKFEGKVLAEQQMALTKDFEPTGYFSKDVWVRMISDVTAIGKSGKDAIIIDWKTGKIDNDPLQLDLCAFGTFQYFPKLETLSAFYGWVKDGVAGPVEKYTRENVGFLWGALQPRVRRMEKAYDENEWPKQPSGLCKRHCPVTGCEFNGRRE